MFPKDEVVTDQSSEKDMNIKIAMSLDSLFQGRDTT
jgi:hypothetical protein